MRLDSDDSVRTPRVSTRGARLDPRCWATAPDIGAMDARRLAAAFEARGQGELASRRAVLDRKRCAKCAGFGGPWVEVRRLVGEPGRQRTVRDFVRQACPRCRGRGVL